MIELTDAGIRAHPVVLASGSAVRATLLRNAGVPVEIVPAHIDEAEVKAAARAEGADSIACAITLAELKAQRVTRTRPGALVIGADQLLECGAVWFDKPADRAHAASHLRSLRGRTHELITAVVVVCDGQRLWHHVERPKLTMREFDDAFAARYLDVAGDRVLTSVGGYQLEGLGVQLFSRIDGDHFSILGLPLLPLLAFLRHHRVVP